MNFPLSKPSKFKNKDNQEIINEINTTNQLNYFKNKAYTQFPYFFEKNQRIEYIKNKEEKHEERQTKKLNKIIKKFIIVRRVKSFDICDSSTVLETWLVDKNTLTVAKKCKGFESIEQMYYFQQNYRPKQCKINQKMRNILFLGRSNNADKSITFEDPSISNKHLILEKEKNPQNQSNQIVQFLLCWNFSLKTKNGSVLQKILSSLSTQLIKMIVKYLGIIIEDQFVVSSKYSSNKSSYFPYNSYKFTKQNKDIVVLSQQDGLALKFQNIIKKTRLSSNISVNIDHAVALSLQNKLVHICNRNLQIQQSMKNQNSNGQILILKAITPRKKKIFILYSQQTPYSVIISNCDINIIVKQTNQLNECFGEIVFSQQKWSLISAKPKSMHFSLDRDILYRVKNEICLRLGKQTKIMITLNEKIDD